MDTPPPRTATLARTARQLMLGRQDLENVAIAGFGLVIFFQVAGMVLLRLVSFLLMPLLVLVRYPAQRAADLREAEQESATVTLAAQRAAQGGQ